MLTPLSKRSPNTPFYTTFPSHISHLHSDKYSHSRTTAIPSSYPSNTLKTTRQVGRVRGGGHTTLQKLNNTQWPSTHTTTFTTLWRCTRFDKRGKSEIFLVVPWQRPKPNFLNTFLSDFSFYLFFVFVFDSWNLIMDKFYNRQNNKSYSFFLVSFCWNHFFSPSCTVRYVLSDTHKLDFSSFLPISFTFHLVHCYNPQKEKTAVKCPIWGN